MLRHSMANKDSETVNDSESEGDSLKVITDESTKSQGGLSRRTFSTSEVDREEKESAKILKEFLSRSPIVNLTRHAPLVSTSRKTEATGKSIPVTENETLNSASVNKKKMSDKAPSPHTFSSPPVRHRPSELPSRSRSYSVPGCSDSHRSTVSNEKCLP